MVSEILTEVAMHKGKGFARMNRREFLKVGLVGTASSLLGATASVGLMI